MYKQVTINRRKKKYEKGLWSTSDGECDAELRGPNFWGSTGVLCVTESR